MDQARKVPWTDWSDWERCRLLFQQRDLKCLEILETWLIRDALPVRVECTRMILSALKELSNSLDPQNLLNLKGEVPRLALSMLITRCTNLIVDLHNDCKYARSVSNTAKLIKIPEFVVDLRHDATHGGLPSMFLLSRAVSELLAWLEQEYWEKQAHYLQEKAQKTLKDIEKFEQRARVTKDAYTLAKYAEGLFTQKIRGEKQKIGKIVSELRWAMEDDAWALMFLQLNSKNVGFAASVMQGMMYLLYKEKINIEQAKNGVQELLALAGNIRLSYTQGIKNVLIKLANDKAAAEIIEILLNAKVFNGEIQNMVDELYSLATKKTVGESAAVIGELPMKRWRNLRYWDIRPIGSNSTDTEPL